jgi:peptidyl-prolyl cis-trans isomerase C
MKPTRRTFGHRNAGRRTAGLLALAPLVWTLANGCAGAEDTQEPAAGGSAAPAAASSPATPAFDPARLPDVVARVGDRPVTREELLAEAAGARTQMLQNGVPREQTETAEFYRQALDQIVAGILLFEEAQREGLAPSDTEVSQRIDAMRQAVPAGQSFEQALAAQGLRPESLAQEIKVSLSLERILVQKIAPQVAVTEEEARSFYDQNPARMERPPRIRIRHILLKVTLDTAAEAKAATRARAEELRERIAGGADFATVARESSEDQVSRDRGGELPWIAPGQTVPEFEEAAFSLGAGELSPVVETRYGYHVIQGIEQQPAQKATFEEVKGRITALLREREARELLHRHVDELKSATPVEILL